MSNGPKFFQTPMGRHYFEKQLPDQIKAMNRLAEAIEKQNQLNTPKNEYCIYYKKDYRSVEMSVIVYAHSKEQAKEDFYKEQNYEIYDSRVELVQLGG